MGNMIAIHDVVIPVPRTWLKRSTGKLEGASPSSGLRRVSREWKLAGVVVPGAEKVDCLDVGRGAKSERE